MPRDLGIEERLRRKMSRPARTSSINVRFAEDELTILNATATRRGAALREWARETLLAAARSNREMATFTEVIALRQFTTDVLRRVACGKPMTEEEYSREAAAVRRDKHRFAAEVLEQYRDEPEVQR